MHYITFELLFVPWAGLAYLFLTKKTNKLIFFHTKSEINKPQALHLIPNLSQHGDRRDVSE